MNKLTLKGVKCELFNKFNQIWSVTKRKIARQISDSAFQANRGDHRLNATPGSIKMEC